MPPNVIKENTLELKESLGRGAFGYVKKALWTPNSIARKKTVDVALKFPFRDEIKDELGVMAELKNKYIVKLLGCSKVNGKPCLVMEFMNQGCLTNFVRKNKTNLVSSDMKIVTQILENVARGMKYLSRKGFVHRDLAARNVLVHLDKKDFCIGKIADFGLARNDDYYISRFGEGAFSWMAPEVHEGHGHSAASDVWSFGILSWESYTFGRQPFSGLNAPQVRGILRTKKIPLKCPKYCSSKVFLIIQKCWTHNPKNRITFTKLVKELADLK